MKAVVLDSLLAPDADCQAVSWGALAEIQEVPAGVGDQYQEWADVVLDWVQVVQLGPVVLVRVVLVQPGLVVWNREVPVQAAAWVRWKRLFSLAE